LKNRKIIIRYLGNGAIWHPVAVAGIAMLFVMILAGCGSGTSNPGSSSPRLWIADQQGILGTVDVNTGDVQVVGSMGVVMSDIAVAPNGNLYGVGFTTFQLYVIDKSTAVPSPKGSLGARLNSLAFDKDGRLYGATSALYAVDISTGASTLIGSTGGYVSSGDLAFVGTRLYLSSVGTNDSLFALDVATGRGNFIGSIGFPQVFALATDKSGVLYGVTGTRLLRINPDTGAGTVLVNYGGHGLGVAYGADLE
jgi:hypothetical protein